MLITNEKVSPYPAYIPIAYCEGTADNVVTYSYDSAGNRITKVVSAPSEWTGFGFQSTVPQSSQPKEDPTHPDFTETQSE